MPPSASFEAPDARAVTPAGEPRRFGFWTCCALVVGNMIGSGIFLLPAALAPFGKSSLLGWLFTASGAIALAVVFARLSHALPQAGGPYAFTRAAFGDFTAFLVVWGYWVSVWVGNAAIATGAVSYLVPLSPWMAAKSGHAAIITLLAVWILTLINCYGIRAVGWTQNITTVMKIVPLVALAVGGFWFIKDHPAVAMAPVTLGGATATATLTLWAFLGLESATIPADKVRDPAVTIPRATNLGTLLTVILCVAACSAVLLLVPATQLSSSNAPFADAARLLWGTRAAQCVSVLAAISGFGALNGWILVQAEVPSAMARAGVFPRIFAQHSARQTPIFALVFTSALMTALVLMNFQSAMVQVFTFMILLSTAACLFMYLVCALALLKLLRTRQLADAPRSSGIVAALAALYSLWAIVGAGWSALLWGLALLILGIPVFLLVRRPRVSI
jgi:basic amino acid/polyamine antiporter, APA family